MAPSGYSSLSPELAAVRATLSNLGSPDGPHDSPASTYGGTMTTGSHPPTPHGTNTQAYVTHTSHNIDSTNINYSPLFQETRRSSPVTIVKNDKNHDSDNLKAENISFHSQDNHDNPFDGNRPDQFSTHFPPTPQRGQNLVHDSNLPSTPIRVDSTQSERSSSGFSGSPGRTKDSDGQGSTNPGCQFEPVTADNAQALLPPRACVFVANLAQERTDEELQASVTEAFQQYGKVYVKIRRDPRHMPFAFAQFENASHAHQALTQGKGLIIDGRPCRTEPSKANRSVYLSKLIGGPIEEQEAHSALKGFGVVEEVWQPSLTEREMYGLAEGIFVKFEYQQDRRKALTGMRDSTIYHLEDPGVHGHNGSLAMTRKPRGFMHSSQGSPDTPTRLRHRNGNVDRRSVVVMNISEATTQEELSTRFMHYGPIISITSVNKPSIQGRSASIFATIEYTRETAAYEAISNEDGTKLHGNVLHVDRSDSTFQYRRRLQNASQYPRFSNIAPDGHLSHGHPKATLHSFGAGRNAFRRFSGYGTGSNFISGTNIYTNTHPNPGANFSHSSSAGSSSFHIYPPYEKGPHHIATNNLSSVNTAGRMTMQPYYQPVGQFHFPQTGYPAPYFPYPTQQHGLPHPIVYMAPEFPQTTTTHTIQSIAPSDDQTESRQSV